jgi:hypothetical protein
MISLGMQPCGTCALYSHLHQLRGPDAPLRLPLIGSDLLSCDVSQAAENFHPDPEALACVDDTVPKTNLYNWGRVYSRTERDTCAWHQNIRDEEYPGSAPTDDLGAGATVKMENGEVKSGWEVYEGTSWRRVWKLRRNRSTMFKSRSQSFRYGTLILVVIVAGNWKVFITVMIRKLRRKASWTRHVMCVMVFWMASCNSIRTRLPTTCTVVNSSWARNISLRNVGTSLSIAARMYVVIIHSRILLKFIRRQIIIECQGHDDYQQSIKWLLFYVEEYATHSKMVMGHGNNSHAALTPVSFLLYLL